MDALPKLARIISAARRANASEWLTPGRVFGSQSLPRPPLDDAQDSRLAIAVKPNGYRGTSGEQELQQFTQEARDMASHRHRQGAIHEF